MTVLDFQKYLLEMLKGNPKYTLKNAKLYFSRYYKDFLQYYKEVILIAENVNRTREWNGFIYSIQEYLTDMVKILDTMSKTMDKTFQTFVSAGKAFDKFYPNPTDENRQYAKLILTRSVHIFNQTYGALNEAIDKSILFREINDEDKINFYNRVVSKMVYESGYQKDIEREMSILEYASNVFNSNTPQYYFHLAVEQIDKELINNIGE